MNQERGLSVVRDFTVASVAAEDGFLAADGQQIMADGIVKCDLETGDIEFVHSGQEAHEIRALIMRVQRSLEALPYQTEFVVEHEFCDGMYLRKLHIPKGTLLIGKIHKQPCMNIVAKGDIAILTETGAKRVTAGFSVPSPAGIQKLGYANQDTVFINVFRTDETNPETIEDALTWESYEAIPPMIEGDMPCQ